MWRNVVGGKRDGSVFREGVGVDEDARGCIERIRYIEHRLVLAAVIALEEVPLPIPCRQTEAFEGP